MTLDLLLKWAPIINIVVTIAGLFITGYINLRTFRKKESYNQKLIRYKEAYIPFIKMIYLIRDGHMNLFALRSAVNPKTVESDFDRIEKHLFDHFEQLGEKLPPMIMDLNEIVNDRFSMLNAAQVRAFSDLPTVEEAAASFEEAMELFDKIVIEMLVESESLVRELSLEPVSRPLLAKYAYEKAQRKPLIHMLQTE